MLNLQKEKTPIPEQNPKERINNFDEVSLGYNTEQAVNEALRCLNCKDAPCVKGCPVNVNIPKFIELLVKGDVAEAQKVIKETNALPAICGRVCPQETQCEQYCVRGIKHSPVAIGRLERFVADHAILQTEEFTEKHSTIMPNVNIKNQNNKKKVAIVGAGPAGLVCASDLCGFGYDVTIFEAFHTPGGVLVYGIPEFRLPKAIVKYEIENLIRQGIKIETDVVIGRTITVEELLDNGYSAVFIASGAGIPNFMNIPGENLNGVYSANEFLTRINLMKAYIRDYDTPIKRHKRVGVVGGGNVAMDAARSALRLGAEEVNIIYRRGEKELPARREEIHHAKEEGIKFRFLTNPVEIIGNEKGEVVSIKCVNMELGEPDKSGRQQPKVIHGSEHEIKLDSVIIAIGTSPNPIITMTTKGIKTNEWGCILVDDNGKTSKQYVYAGGDAVTGSATVISAMGAGKKAAAAININCQGKNATISHKI